MASFCAGKKSGEETAAGDCTKYGFSLFTWVINFLLLRRSKSSMLQSPFSLKILWGPDHFGATFDFWPRNCVRPTALIGQAETHEVEQFY